MTWKKIKLKKLLSRPVQNGYSPVCPETPNGKWILGLGALSDSGLNVSQIKPAPPNDRRVDDFLLQAGDFLISRSNTRDKVGRSALFKGEIENCSYPDLIMRFRVDELLIYPEFLEMYLRSSDAIQHFQSSASGTSKSMVKITKGVVERLQVALPPQPEQKAIAALLSTWDLAIEKTERLISAKEKQFEYLLNKLINQGSTNGTWQQEKLGKVADIRMGSSPPSRAYNEDEIGLPFMQGKADLKNRVSAPRVFTNEVTQECFDGDLLLSVRAPVGYVSRSMHHGCIGRGLAALSIKNGFVTDFVFFFLLSIEPLWMKVAQGGTFDAISSTELRRILICFPSTDQQKQIADVLNTAQREIDLLNEQAEAHRRQKRGLMQKVLSGNWTIKVCEVATGER